MAKTLPLSRSDSYVYPAGLAVRWFTTNSNIMGQPIDQGMNFSSLFLFLSLSLFLFLVLVLQAPVPFLLFNNPNKCRTKRT